MKVIGVGCPKTGTTTLGDCLSILGFTGAWFDEALFREVVQGRTQRALEHAAHYDALVDLPWSMLYRELDEAFPGSRFILTVRRDSRVWLKSYRRHHATTHGALLSADGSRATYRSHDYAIWPAGVEGYEAHNAAVTEYFRDRPESLLTVCWDGGSGWRELVEFLGVKEPDSPFPHSNESRATAAALKLGWLHLRRMLRST